MWNRMPYAKRYTTPTTVVQTEEAMVIGYWVRAKAEEANVAPRICEKHIRILAELNRQEERQNAPTTPPPPPASQPSLAPITNGNINTCPPLPAIAEPPTFNTILAPEKPETAREVVQQRLRLGGELGSLGMTGGQEQFGIHCQVDPEPSAPLLRCPLCRKGVKAGEVHTC